MMVGLSAGAATWYVDSAASGSNTGTSWANAWTSLSSISGLSSGDTVYISGGPSGSTRSYSAGGGFPSVNGSSSTSRITYQIGQDSQHNGTAILNLGGSYFLSASIANVNILGDAGDGQMHFQVINLGGIAYISDYSAGQNFRVAYINFGSANAGFDIASPFGMEFDHNYFFKIQEAPGSSADHFLGGADSAKSGYGVNLIHHNTVYLPRGGLASGYGDDGVTLKSGCDIYNNSFIGYATNYTGQQHQDAFQPTWGGYDRFFNNHCVNMANSCVFPETVFGDINHVRVFNNICSCDNASICGQPMRAMDINSGWSTPNGYGYYDVVVANNLIVDLGQPGNSAVFAVRMDDNIFTFTGCVCANNISINSQGYDLNYAVTNLANIGDLSAAGASGFFVSYTPFSDANNFHLLGSAATLRGKGVNLSSYFSTDADGNSRPAGGAWDIGPYQFQGQATNPIIQVSPISLSFGPVATGSVVTNSFTVQNVGVGILAGSARVAAPFQIVSGGTYSLGANQSQTVQISYQPTGAASDSQTVTFTGGGGATATATGSLLAVLPGLSFPSTSGTITAPFLISGNSIYQSAQTTVSGGGTAVYGFVITNAGQYTVTANVEAPGDANNSFYINMDTFPTDPTMIWDIPIYAGFTNEVVSWRGNGTDTAPQFAPQIWNLSAGTHQLIVIGREADTYLGQITIAPYLAGRPTPPSPPLGLHIVGP